MKAVFVFLFGVGLGWLLRPRAVQTTNRAPQLAAGRTLMADAPPMADPLPMQAFLAAYQQANRAAWEALGAIHTHLESGDDPALDAQGEALKVQMRAMAGIGRERAAQLLASFGAIARLDGITQTLVDRTAELPAATDALPAARSVVGAAKSFVSFFN